MENHIVIQYIKSEQGMISSARWRAKWFSEKPGLKVLPAVVHAKQVNFGLAISMNDTNDLTSSQH
jgi:hypothetical protein